MPSHHAASFADKLLDAFHYAKQKPALALGIFLVINLPLLRWLGRRARYGRRGGSRQSGKVFFTLPTLARELPAVGRASVRPVPGALVMRSDDWIQIEFRHPDNRPQVDKALDRIRSIRSKAIQNGPMPAFRELYSREPALVGFERVDLTLLELAEGLRAEPTPRLYVVATLRGDDIREIIGGFSIPIASGGMVYGVESEGKIVALGCDARGMSNNSLYDLAQVEKLRGTLLVDWLGDRVGIVGTDY